MYKESGSATDIKQIARGFEVTGYVKNLLDGRLELDIEGYIKRMLSLPAGSESELDNFIRDTERSDGHRKRLYTRFRIA